MTAGYGPLLRATKAFARHIASRLPGLAMVRNWLLLPVALVAAARLDAQAPPVSDLRPRIIVQSGHAAPISAAAWTPDGAFVVTGSSDGQVLVWDVAGRIVSRTALGQGGDRVVVEKIDVAADGKSATVYEILFRDMYDNGVASEVLRRRYSVHFGADRGEAGASEPVDVPWAGRTGFLAGSLAMKDALVSRTDGPISSRGVRLEKREGELAMVPSGPGAHAVLLRGVLGPDRDGGDARLEARAQRIEELGQAIDRNAEIADENARNCGPDDAAPCAARKPFVAVGALESGAPSLGQRPQLSPDGRRLAWIDAEAASWTLRVLDVQRAVTRSARFEGAIGELQYGWRDAATLVLRTPAGWFEVDGDNVVLRRNSQPGCLPTRVGELTQPAGGTAAVERCPAGPDATDARTAVRLTLEKGMVRVNDVLGGELVCTAFLDQSEIVPAAIALASADSRSIVLQSATGYTELFAVPVGRGDGAKPGARPHNCPVVAQLRADPGRVGFHPALPLLWIEGRGGRIDFYRIPAVGRDGLGAPLFTLFRLPGGRFFAIDPVGRYDTNLPPDTDAVRWTMPDAPLQSLAPQTFMRDYYQPGLMRRLLECVAMQTDCDARFPPIPSLATLNRVLPKVRIVGVRPGASAAEAVVSVAVEDGHDPTAANGKTTTGVYDVRLFRNNRLVFHHPDQVFADEAAQQAELDRLRALGDGNRAYFEWLEAHPDHGSRRPEFVADKMRTDIGYWRSLSQVRRDPVKGYPILDFHVDLPTAAGTELSEFSVYAFNEDRVKSDTARVSFRRAAVKPAKPRAFVVSIGIDVYDSPNVQQLQFAASDADLIASRLAAIPGYEVRRLTLAAKRTEDGRALRVTRDAIEILFSALGGADAPVSAHYLNEQGFDARALDNVRPDDILIVAFSGHGWADPQGNFYMLPSDAVWPAGADAPERSSLFSSASLAMFLSSKMQAAEIALVIDACHSAASVSGADFRPGPMGDSGLGQIAFDKGVRILAATQADDVALEDPTLRQGLLTYALAGEGITADGGKADTDADGKITLDEWLAYAARRMPSLSSDVRLGRLQTGASGARGWVRVNAAAAKPTVQEPSLFDFNARPSGVVLREGPGR